MWISLPECALDDLLKTVSCFRDGRVTEPSARVTVRVQTKMDEIADTDAAESPSDSVDVSLVGRRCRAQGSPATVRWGPGFIVKPKANPADEDERIEVVGVEYDQEGRGKHDGNYQGSQLFKCRDGHGSFIKLDKIDLGVSIQRALADRYFDVDPDVAARKDNDRCAAMTSFSWKTKSGKDMEMALEFVGMHSAQQRQKRLEAFVQLGFSDTSLSGRYPDDVWEGDWSLPNVKLAWLGKTLLNEWADVLAINELCPNLDFLSLQGNRMVQPDGPDLGVPRFAPASPCVSRIAMAPFASRVTTLQLGSTHVTWEHLVRADIGRHFKCLTHLSLEENRLIEGVPEDLVGVLPALQILNLAGNGIRDWRVLQRVARAFPTLKELHLQDNLLGETMEGMADVAADQTPRRLTVLNLNRNKISTWAQFGALTEYALLELKIQHNPIIEGDAAVTSWQVLRQVAIALMPTILRFNSGEVVVWERKHCEIHLCVLADQGSSIVDGLRETCNIDAHLERLRAMHCYERNPTNPADTSENTMAHQLFEVRLQPFGAEILGMNEVKKKLPGTMTVGELKKLCFKLFKQKIPLDRIKLVWVDGIMNFPLDLEHRELSFFGLVDGCVIRVDDVKDLTGDKNVKQVEMMAASMECDADDV